MRKENARLKSKDEEHERQSAEKTYQISGLRKVIEGLEKEHQLELLQKAQTKVYDMPGVIYFKNISTEEGKNLVLTLKRRNTIIREAIESNRQVSFGSFFIAKHEMKLIPIQISVDINNRRISMSLWEKLPRPSPSVPASSDAASDRF